ncbi:hypothetical protein ACKWTF_015135 [Chironomus riparius]
MKKFLVILILQFSIISSTIIPQNLLEIQIICEHTHWLEADWAIKLHPELFTNPDTSKHYIKCQLPPGVQPEEKVKIVSVKYPNQAHADFMAKNPDIPKILIFHEQKVTELMPFGIADVFTNVIELKIIAKGLKFITRENFAGLTDLKNLKLGNNKLASIPFDAFYELPNLETLDLYRCNLKELNEDLFINNPNLKNVSAPLNDIQVLPAGIFRNNLKLENVNMNFNDFKDIQVDFTKFENLKKASFEKSKDYDNESSDY